MDGRKATSGRLAPMHLLGLSTRLRAKPVHEHSITKPRNAWDSGMRLAHSGDLARSS